MSVDLAVLKILESTGADLEHLLKIIPSSDLLRTKIHWDVNNNPIYVGLSTSDASLSDPRWLIRKILWDVNNNPTDILFADGEIEFTKVMSDYLSYTYSAS